MASSPVFHTASNILSCVLSKMPNTWAVHTARWNIGQLSPGLKEAGRYTSLAFTGNDFFSCSMYGLNCAQKGHPYEKTSVTSILPGESLGCGGTTGK